MFPLFPENRKSIPWFLRGKILLKNVTLKSLNFISVSKLTKIFPFGVMLSLGSFVLVIAVKTRLKINITPYGEMFYYLTYQDKI